MTDRYAVIGNPISHSKSPLIHSSFASATCQDLAYTTVEGPLDGFEAAVRAFRDGGGRGMNVTAPFKLQAFAMADSLTERARQAGAVNALKFEAGRILADNFDGLGLVRDITQNLGAPLRGKRLLLLGAGGAARGALLPLLDQQPAELVVANRNPERAAELVAEMVAEMGSPAGLRGGGFAEIGTAQFDVIVNATSASLKGELPPLPAAAFAPGALAYEMVYGKGLTPFLRLAQNAGVARLADGVGMLVEQAAEAFAWWRGVRPATREVIDQLTIPLK